MIEQWIRWEPIQGLASKYCIDDVHVTSIEEELIILLYEYGNKKNKIRVTFDSVHAYMCADETYRSRLIHDLDNKYGGDFYSKWTFFKVHNSEYLKWLSNQSGTVSEHRGLIHFCFIAENFILDIINPPFEPKIEFI